MVVISALTRPYSDKSIRPESVIGQSEDERKKHGSVVGCAGFIKPNIGDGIDAEVGQTMNPFIQLRPLSIFCSYNNVTTIRTGKA